jgi:hypothetical protein
MNPKYTLVFVFWVILALVFPDPTFSQSSFGIKAGMNMGDIKVRSKTLLVDEQYAPLRLWHLGVMGSKDFSKKISGQVELLFSQKGGQSPLDLSMPNPLEAYWQYKLTYLSMPLLFQYKAGPLSFEAGPEVGYLIGQRTLRNDMVVEDDLSNFVQRSWDFALTAGFKFTVERFFTEVRWSRGITSLGEVRFTDMNGSHLGEYQHFSHTLHVSLGYLIVVKKTELPEIGID